MIEDIFARSSRGSQPFPHEDNINPITSHPIDKYKNDAEPVFHKPISREDLLNALTQKGEEMAFTETEALRIADPNYVAKIDLKQAVRETTRSPKQKENKCAKSFRLN